MTCLPYSPEVFRFLVLAGLCLVLAIAWDIGKSLVLWAVPHLRSWFTEPTQTTPRKTGFSHRHRGRTLN